MNIESTMRKEKENLYENDENEKMVNRKCPKKRQYYQCTLLL